MKRPGFTLMELLVVIAVIAVLIAICVPALRAARDSARAVKCGANIRQLLVGMRLYENENGRFPPSFVTAMFAAQPPGGFAGKASSDKPGRWWFNYMTDFTQEHPTDMAVLWCPSRSVDVFEFKTDVLCGNYGVNLSICKNPYGSSPNAAFASRSLSADSIREPGRTLLLVDSGYATIGWRHVMTKPPILPQTPADSTYIPGLRAANREKYIRPFQSKDAFEGRHPGRKVNVGFVDGHVALTPADDLAITTSEEDGYEKRCPTWTPVDE